MPDEYTPTTENVRTAWISYRLDPERYGSENFGRGPALVAEFDRWLREHDREVAERAWNELYVTQFDGAPFEMSDTTGITDPNNPYRAALRVGANPKENEHDDA